MNIDFVLNQFSLTALHWQHFHSERLQTRKITVISRIAAKKLYICFCSDVFELFILNLTQRFTEELSGLSKDAAPGPDKVKYSDIKNLSVDNKSEFFIIYEESFTTGQIPEDWSHR